jgi:hypothetical protein
LFGLEGAIVEDKFSLLRCPFYLGGELFNALGSLTDILKIAPDLRSAFEHLLLKFLHLIGSTVIVAWPVLPCRYCDDRKSHDGSAN